MYPNQTYFLILQGLLPTSVPLSPEKKKKVQFVWYLCSWEHGQTPSELDSLLKKTESFPTQISTRSHQL